jgi:hypothetical protein
MGTKRHIRSICQKISAERSIFSFGLAAIVGCGPASMTGMTDMTHQASPPSRYTGGEVNVDSGGGRVFDRLSSGGQERRSDITARPYPSIKPSATNFAIVLSPLSLARASMERVTK